ncbi:hypothetical protein HNQ51_001844 [Inhella inkyongensis]|uniref:Uncharacterized protein n=1 Tax=Inhella inkyongensis TaxID=392593 RepID=A0A840S7W2_9BURK|nr:hypothetical protein [Inhella inkyongensis]MBB5204530.1 hypothetical protein [Inhella inkyongensis]
MRSLLFSLSLSLAPMALAAAPTEPFEAGTWPRLQREVREPTWVVFSASDCAHCPGLIARLQQQYPQVPLWRVETDAGEPAEQATAARHFSFGAGNALALRHGIDPQWRGMTPYLALLRPGQAPLFALAQPSSAQLQALQTKPETRRKARPTPSNQ